MPSADPRGKDAPAYRLWPPVSVAAPLALAWALHQAMPIAAPLPRAAQLAFTVAFALVFLALNGPGYLMMLRERTGILPGAPAARVLTTGPFRLSRNPLYVGLVALHLAIAFAWGSAWALLLAPSVALGLHFGAVLPEERYLEAKFGEDYLRYKRQVRRWL